MFWFSTALVMSGHGDAQAGQPVRIYPNAHGIGACAEDLHLPDARETGQRVLQIDSGVVRQEDIVVRAGRRVEVEQHEGGGRAGLHDHTLLGHLAGQL